MGMSRLEMMEKGLVDQYGEQVKATLGEDGKEYGDPVPKAPPARIGKPSMADQIRQMIRREVSMRAEESDFESFEDADDFDVDDDPADPHTPYEAVFDPLPLIKENDDGDKGRDEGRSDAPAGGSGQSGKVGKGKPSSKQPAVAAGSVREAGDGDSGSEGED